MQKNNIFFNRELSWIEFNARVLKEAQNKTVPLFERIKFLSIVSSNFDEFFMVRVAGLKNQALLDPAWTDITGLTAKEQLSLISKRAHEVFETQHKLFSSEILGDLKKEGIVYIPPDSFTQEEKRFTENLFREQIFPLLTPLRTEEDGELPLFSNLKVHVAFLLKQMETGSSLYESLKSKDEKPLAFVQVPTVMERIIWLPSNTKERRFTLVEDIIILFGTSLFSGFSVEQTLIFKTVCDAAFAVNEEVEDNFIEAMENIIDKRKKAVPIRLTCTSDSNEIAKTIIKKSNLSEKDVYSTETHFIDLKSFNTLDSLDGFSHLRYPKWKNFYPDTLEAKSPLWDILKQRDMLLHVPYESYDPVLQFVNDAAEDSNVLAIKMTLYRTSGDSPLIKSLIRAAEKGKQVTVFVELKARFDEERNISWAHTLQRAGVIVIHGIAHLKVHAKILYVVRKEPSGIVRYVHMGTGNYNEKTARLYVDMSLFTTNSEIANDIALLFNMISGYSEIQYMNRLFMAPINLKTQLLTMIDREIQSSTKENPGLIIAKMNSLAHPEIIKALYKASCSHVEILLNIRGVCMLVPGIKGQSENIKVISIIDRYLEHTRIFYFQNGGSEEIYLSSADWMSRNLDRRVELMFPVLQKNLFQDIKETLRIYSCDNQKSHLLHSDGTWSQISEKNSLPVRSQESLYSLYMQRAQKESKKTAKEFLVRKKQHKKK